MTEHNTASTMLDLSRVADEAIADFLQAAEEGNAPARDDYINQNGQVRSALESFFDAYDQMGGTRRPSDSDSTGSFKPGAQLGRHRLVRPIANGSFGTVWLGFDSKLKRPVAIKVPNADRFSTKEQRSLFLSEAQTVAQLDHPGIVPIYDVGETESGEVYLVSRFVAGNDLATEMNNRRFTSAETTRCIQRIANALEYAHGRNLVHRDIKPSNILIDAVTGVPYVTDFGLALNSSTQQGTGVAGTPAYMSPEQASGGTVDHRSDMFSLGVVFYELLCRARPFSGDSTDAIMESIQSDSPTLPQHVDANVLKGLQNVCMKCLAKSPEKRHASMLELESQLISCQASTGPDSKQRWTTVIVFGIAALFLGLGFSLGWFQPDDNKTPKVANREASIRDSFDREIAEETIRMGGHIDVRFEGLDYEVNSIDDIPDGNISLLWVMFADNQTITDEYIDRLSLLDSLEGVDFYSCEFSDESFAKLAAVKSLRIVHAPATRLTDAGLKPLATLPRLHRLMLTGTNIGDDALSAFQGNKTLKSLRIGETRVTDEGLKYIGTMRNLESLTLDNCRIGDAGVKYLQSLTHLEVAKFGQTKITDLSLQYLEECPIRQLIVPPFRISEEAANKFLESHANCRIIRN
jgi:serine/threonine protein kinase